MTRSKEKLAWLPDYLYTGGRFVAGLALVCDESGIVTRLASPGEVSCELVRFKNRAILPGMVNAHSHAFQRVIRGRTEYRSHVSTDSFWTWREIMYSAAMRLDPEDVYQSSRMAFLEMALGGITTVGEFHYLHNDPHGAPYDDPNQLAKEVIRAARDVGLRIALLRVAYARSGFRVDPNERQNRFLETEPDVYLRNVERLRKDLAGRVDSDAAWVGLAPHSVRAVPLDYLREVHRYGEQQNLKVHMHVAEQPAENNACVSEHGRTVVDMLASEGLLSDRFTCVHAVHVTNEEASEIGRARAIVCACPTTERNLGDGVVAADVFFENDVRIAFGSDSHTQIDLLEDARQLEYNLRLTKLQRNVLAPENGSSSSLAERLFEGATINGAASVGASNATLEAGRHADFFTVALDDPSIASSTPDELLSNIVFSLARTAVRDVFVAGVPIVEDGRHAKQPEIVEDFTAVQKRLWESF